MRVPCVMRWPGRIPAGKVQDELCSTMDLLPSLAQLAGAALPERRIDGRDSCPLLFSQPGARSHWDEDGFAYYRREQLQAVRSGPWKLYLPLNRKLVNNAAKTAAQPTKGELYDVRADVHENREISAQHPEVVARLVELADRIRAEIGDGETPGTGQRKAGWVEAAQPLQAQEP